MSFLVSPIFITIGSEDLVFIGFSAYEAFGSGGKLAIEVCMIGFMMGTCIAFFVVIGDLAPPIIANILRVDSTPNLRLVILIGKSGCFRSLYVIAYRL